MKTKFTLLVALAATFSTLFAQQIPNAGFETWSAPTAPDNWTSVDKLFGAPLGFCVKDTVSKVEGLASVKIKSDSIAQVPQAGVVPGILSLGSATYVPGGQPTFYGIPFAFRPDTLFFAYKYAPAAGDTAGLEIVLTQAGNTLLGGGIALTGTAGNWASVYIPMTSNYTAAGTPDTLYLQFFSSYNQGVKGSVLNIDRVRFGYVSQPSGVKSMENSIAVTLYPNPAYDNLTIASTESLTGFTFEAVNMEGKVVLTEVLKGQQSTISINSLSTGNYIYQVKDLDGVVVSTDRFNIAK